MAIIPTDGRNIVHFARKIVAERMIAERRLFETMRDNKNHEDVSVIGREGLENFRAIMIAVSCVDLLNVGIPAIHADTINLTESQSYLIDKLSRYLLIELESADYDKLVDLLALAIQNWSYSKDQNVGRFILDSSNSLNEDGEPNKSLDEIMQEEVDNIRSALTYSPQYVTYMLLADLHHLTYVASADQCSEILLST